MTGETRDDGRQAAATAGLIRDGAGGVYAVPAAVLE